MKTLIVLGAGLFLTACVSGPKPEKPSGVADALDYRNYESTGTVASVPVLKRARRQTQIRGRLKTEDPLLVVPNRATIRLLQDGKTIAESSADHGRFELRGNIPNGDYLLEASARCLRGTRKVSVSSYELNDAEVALEKTRCDGETP